MHTVGERCMTDTIDSASAQQKSVCAASERLKRVNTCCFAVVAIPAPSLPSGIRFAIQLMRMRIKLHTKAILLPTRVTHKGCHANKLHVLTCRFTWGQSGSVPQQLRECRLAQLAGSRQVRHLAATVTDW